MLASKRVIICLEVSQACFGIGPDDLCKLSEPNISTDYGIRMGSIMEWMKPSSGKFGRIVSDYCDLTLARNPGCLLDCHVLVNVKCSSTT